STGGSTEVATASEAVSRSQQAEGGDSGGAVTAARGGRGRGNGTTCAPAISTAAKRITSVASVFTVAISAGIATLWRPIGAENSVAVQKSASFFAASPKCGFLNQSHTKSICC